MAKYKAVTGSAVKGLSLNEMLQKKITQPQFKRPIASSIITVGSR